MDPVEKANALASQDRHAEALLLYLEAVRKSPGDERGYCGAAISLMETKRSKEAVPYLKKLMGLVPGAAYPHGVMGQVMERDGRPDEALACYEKMAELDPDEVLAHFRKAQIMLSRGLEKEYEKCIAHLLKLKPARASHAEDQGRVAVFIKETRLCGSDGLMPGTRRMRSTLRCGPPENRVDPDLLAERAASLAAGGMFEEAAAAAGEAARIDPDFASAHRAEAEAMAGLGRYREALGCIGEAVGLRPRDDRDLAMQGMLLERLGRPLEAARCYGLIAEADGSNMPARYLRCGALACAGDAEALAECYREAIGAEAGKRGARLQSLMRAELADLESCADAAGSAGAGLAEFMRTGGVGVRPKWGRAGGGGPARPVSRRRARGEARRDRLRAGRRA